MATKQRCVNIDWFECYLLEPFNTYPLDAEYFQRCGYHVIVRPYGTRIYEQMFIVCDERNEPFVEVRRKPFKSDGNKDLFVEPYACHVKLSNRYCYLSNAVDIFREFIIKHNYTFKRIFRIDICNDFELFDRGDNPQDFVQRYMRGVYSKINQSRLSAHGADTWDSRVFNSLSWGNKKSMVSTKMYNKTQELAEAHFKPWIVNAWFNAGLIDEPTRILKKDSDGKLYAPNIWRVEFSIKASGSKWFIIDSEVTSRKKRIPTEHTLSTYDHPDKLLQVFNNLAFHYFHFKIFQKDVRKDRCQDKVLFDIRPQDVTAQLMQIADAESNCNFEDRLTKYLHQYLARQPQNELKDAAQRILDDVFDRTLQGKLMAGQTLATINAYKLIIRERIQGINDPRSLEELISYLQDYDGF